jgi:hypothetical protein
MYRVDPDPTCIEGYHTVKGPGMENIGGRTRSIRLYPDPEPMESGAFRQRSILTMMLELAYEAGKKARSEEISKLLKG